MEIAGQIIGFIFAISLLVLAYKLYANDKIPSAVLVAWASVVILACSLSWVQGFAKAFIASKIATKFQELGEQVNSVQQTTSEMHSRLDAHQKEIDAIQVNVRVAETNLSSQQTDMTKQFNQLAIIQTNLEAQAAQLSDVEYWVKNLYTKMVIETFTKDSTNNIFFLETNNCLKYIARLSHVPIKGSFECYIRDTSSGLEQRVYDTENRLFIRNIFQGHLYNYDTNRLTIVVHYVMDERETNIFKRMPNYGNEFSFLDNGLVIYKDF